MPDRFTPYGLLHFVVLTVAVAVGVALIRRARGLRDAGDAPGLRRWCRGLALFILAFNGAVQLDRLRPSVWNVDVSLPLHLCDFAWMAAVVALVSRRRLPRALVFYWGLGLSWQAFLTPTLNDGPLTLTFWSFWLLHWGIVITALAEIVVFEFRPSWRDWGRTVLVTLVLFLAVLGVNLVLETPYFFNSPDDAHVEGTPIAWLGPWPMRLLWLGAIVIALFALMTVAMRRPGGARA